LIGFNKCGSARAIDIAHLIQIHHNRHTYKNDPDQNIEIVGSFDTKALHISLRDFGPKPDLSKVQSRSLEHVRPGGLGCHFIKEIMDEVEYDVQTYDIGTELKLVKKRI